MKAEDASTWAKRSGSMVSHDQRNRAALYRFTGASPAANYRMAIELQDYANRIQEHWRAAHDGLHPPTRARGCVTPRGEPAKSRWFRRKRGIHEQTTSSMTASFMESDV